MTNENPLALNYLSWQSLHEISLNTDINVCCSGLTCARACYQHPGDAGINAHIPEYTCIERVNGLSTFYIFHRCCCNLLGSQNAHPSTEAYISHTLFFLCVIYNKKYNRFVVRFKLNRGPSGCRTMCGEPYGSFCSIHNQNTVLSTTYTNSNSLNHPGLCHTPNPRSLFLRNEKLAQLLGTQMGRIIFILLRTTFIVLTLLI